MQSGNLHVGGEINCNISLKEWASFSVWQSRNTILATGRTITGAEDGGIYIGGAFENKGTITVENIWVGDYGTFTNSGIININSYDVYESAWDYTWTQHGSLGIRGKFINNGGTINNRGKIYASGSGSFQMPTNLVTAGGLMFGEKAANFSGSFDFLTLNANGGYFDWWWPPSVSSVVAVPRGALFDLTLLDRIWVSRDKDNDMHYVLIGWSTAATGGEKIDTTNKAFDGTGKTFFALWESYLISDEPYIWDPTQAEINQAIDSAAGGVAKIDFSDITETSVVLPAKALATVCSAGLGIEFTMSQGAIMSFDAKALASLIDELDKSGAEEVTLTVVEQNRSTIAALPDEQKAQIGPNDAVFSITLEVAGKLITEFDGWITITLPWTGAFPAIVWHLASNGTLSRMPTTYNETAKTVTFRTNHLSVYVIKSVLGATDTTGTPVKAGGSPQTGDYRGIVFPLMVMFFGTIGITGWIYYNRKKSKTAK